MIKAFIIFTSSFQLIRSLLIMNVEKILTLFTSTIFPFLLQEEKSEAISKFLAYAHKTVNEMSILYLQNERRYNYTTPKSFLEQIKLYVNLLREKSLNLQAQIIRLENGLEKLNETSSQVKKKFKFVQNY